jgi:hypothetical protein
VEVPSSGDLAACDAAVVDMKGRYSLKDALALAPMDQCVLPHMSGSRAWWRYGWAWGFLGRSLVDAQAPVRGKRYRIAIALGFALGCKHRQELDAVGPDG